MPTLNSVFKIKNWDEKPYIDGPPKMVRAKVQKTFEGDLVGESEVEYLMATRRANPQASSGWNASAAHSTGVKAAS